MKIIPFRIKASKEDDNFIDVYEFLIEGSKKDAYEIEIEIDDANDLGITDTRCTCPHHVFRGVCCKHIQFAIEILKEFGIKTESADKANSQVKKDDEIIPVSHLETRSSKEEDTTWDCKTKDVDNQPDVSFTIKDASSGEKNG